MASRASDGLTHDISDEYDHIPQTQETHLEFTGNPMSPMDKKVLDAELLKRTIEYL